MSRRALVLGIVLVAMLTGCTSGTLPEVQPTVSPSGEDLLGTAIAPVVATGTEPSGDEILPLAGFQGALAITEAGCFGLMEAGTVVPIVFPYGTTVRADGLGVDVPDFGEITVGQEFQARGGDFETTEQVAATLPAECVEDRVLLLFPERL